MRLKVNIAGLIVASALTSVQAHDVFSRLKGDVETAKQPTPPQELALTWPTKAAFMKAVANGDFGDIGRMGEETETKMKPILDSVLHILRNEDGVPALPNNAICSKETRRLLGRLLGDATQMYVGTLSNDGPSFLRRSQETGSLIEVYIKDVGAGHCTTTAAPHPIQGAFTKFLIEYAEATKTVVEAHRDELKATYAANAARSAALQKAAADARKRVDDEKAKQNRAAIDAERTRIENEQKKRLQKDKARIAG